MPENELDVTAHRAKTVIDLREPADRLGENSIIRERFKESGVTIAQTVSYTSSEHHQLIEEERKIAAEKAEKAVRGTRKKTMLFFVAGTVLGLTGGVLVSRGGGKPQSIAPVHSEVTVPKTETVATQSKPEKPKIEYSRELLKAELFQDKGRQKEALAIVESLLANRPEDLYLLYRKAQILQEWGRKWKAVNLLENILEKDDGDEFFTLIRRQRNALKNEIKGGEDSE